MKQIAKIRSESGDAFTYIVEKKKIVREYCEQLCINELDYLDETEKFLETHKLPEVKKNSYNSTKKQPK